MKTLPAIPQIPRPLILYYEVHASWWAPWLFCDWMHTLAGKYFAWKVKRKYARYQRSLEVRDELEKLSRK